MIRKVLKNLTLGTMLAICLLTPAQNVNADNLREGRLNVGGCLQQGGIDFTLFVNSVMFTDGFYDQVIEPWGDILWSNQCQAMDLLALQDQRDRIRSYIRSAFLSCKTESLDGYKRAFYRIQAEMYYARHVVDRKVVVALPYGQVIGNPEILEKPEAELRAEMKAKYVDKGEFFEEKEFDRFFDSLVIKYRTRKEAYKACPNNSWRMVAERWEEFKDEFYSGFGAVDAFEENKRRFGEVQREASELYNTLTTKEGFNQWVSGIVQLNVNNQPYQEGIKEILEEADKQLTQAELLRRLDKSQNDSDTELLRSSLATRFHNLYANEGAATKEFVEELNTLNQTIIDSYTAIDGVKSCSAAINSRQCPGNR